MEKLVANSCALCGASKTFILFDHTGSECSFSTDKSAKLLTIEINLDFEDVEMQFRCMAGRFHASGKFSSDRKASIVRDQRGQSNFPICEQDVVMSTGDG